MDNTKKNKNPITPFAVTNFRDIKKRFGIKEKNRRGHMYIIGKTGAGKSTLMQNMIVSDIRDGKGVAVIDPQTQQGGDPQVVGFGTQRGIGRIDRILSRAAQTLSDIVHDHYR